MPPKAKAPVKPAGTPAVKAEPAPWVQYLPNRKVLGDLINHVGQAQNNNIFKYMNDPATHPDVTSAGKQAYKHIDGFKNAPLYQSPMIHVETNMATRIGGRGLVATCDIPPGTLLLCEYIRHPFQQGLTAEDGTPIRSEVEFLQEFSFDLTPQEQRELFDDFAPLYPFTVDEIDPEHKAFLLNVYGDLIEQCVQHSEQLRANRSAKKTNNNNTKKNQTKANNNTNTSSSSLVTVDNLLRLICLVHFNSFPSGFLLHTAMVNHSCSPNAVKLFISRNEIEKANKQYVRQQRVGLHKGVYQPKDVANRAYNELRSTKYIKAGEEIFISYIPEQLANLTYDQRQVYLYRQFRFKCTCQVCQADSMAFQNENNNNTNNNDDTTSTNVVVEKSTPTVEDTTATTETTTTPEPQQEENQQDRAQLDQNEDWIDELSYNYLNLTKHNQLKELMEEKSNDDNNEENDETSEDNNNAVITNFRQKYGLPNDLSIQAFILLQTVAVLYPLLRTNNDINVNSKLLERVKAKCHKLITLICKDVLEQLGRDVTIDTISVLLYMYVLQLQISNNNNNNGDNVDIQTIEQSQIINKTPMSLIPWNNMIQLSSFNIDHFTILEENPNGLQLAQNNNNNNDIDQKYVLKLTQDKTHPKVAQHEVQPINDNWTLDLFLKQFFIEFNKLIHYNEILTSKPDLLIVNTSQQQDSGNCVEKNTLQQQLIAKNYGDADGQTTVFLKLLQLLTFFKPVSTLLLTQFPERTMACLHITISTIGLISSMYEMKSYIVENKAPTFTDLPSIPQNLRLKIPLTTTYNDMVFSTTYYLESILPHNAYCSKILRLPLLQELIGKTPAEADKFLQAATDVHHMISELYNQCPIEMTVKGL